MYVVPGEVVMFVASDYLSRFHDLSSLAKKEAGFVGFKHVNKFALLKLSLLVKYKMHKKTTPKICEK